MPETLQSLRKTLDNLKAELVETPDECRRAELRKQINAIRVRIGEPMSVEDDDFALRGIRIYKEDVLPKIGVEHEGEFAAIDIDTGEFELHRDDYSATERLLSRNPKARIWLERVGSPTAYRML